MLAKRDDLIAQGLSAEKATEKAKESLSAIDYLIDGNQLTDVGKYHLECMQTLLLNCIVFWIFSLPLLFTHYALTCYIGLLCVIISGCIYISRKDKKVNVVAFLSLSASEQRGKIAWIIWGAFFLVAVGTMAALTFGSDIWYKLDASDLLPKGYENDKSPNGLFKKETDIMDVWFDSGSSFKGVIKDRGYNYPCDLYLEGSDQYRGWFNSSLIISVACFDQTPYKTCVSHGFVMDEHWEKMSKSKGNGIDPNKIANIYGSDILRLWAASVDYQQDVRISESIIKQISESYRKIRNTFKFLLGNLSNGENDYFSLDNLQKKFEDIDLFILAKLERVKNEVIKLYDSYNFQNAVSLILTFMSTDLSSFYLDYAKDILYCDSKKSKRRLQVQSVIYYVVNDLMRLLNPILPFTMD